MKTSTLTTLILLSSAMVCKVQQKIWSVSKNEAPNLKHSKIQDWKKCSVCLVIALLILFPPILSVGINSVNPILGNYKVTFVGRVGGPYEPTGSIIIGTTTGIVPFSLEGNVTLSESEPGVISVPAGTTIPGISPEDIIYGAAVIQNPIDVFIGTKEVNRPGDFGLHSMMKFGLPSDPNQLFYSGCNGDGPFNCLPMFYRRHTYNGESVNLVYFTIDVYGNADSIIINGVLHDRHISEAAALNLFSVPIVSPMLGTLYDIFRLNILTSYKILIKGPKVTGWIKGAGYSVGGLAPQKAVLEVEFEGTKENTAGAQNQTDQEFFVFPNPTEGKFQITGNSSSAYENLKVEVFSILSGKILAVDLNSFPCEIDLSREKGGVYLLRAFNKKTNILKKIVVR